MKSIKLKQNALIFIAALIFFALKLTPSFAQNKEVIKVNNKDVQNALTYYDKEDYKTAKTLLDGIIVKDEKNADAHYALAAVLSKLKKIDDAIEENKRAIELNSNNADYHYQMSMLHVIEVNTANIFSKLSIVGNIKEELISALKIDPTHRLAMINLTGGVLKIFFGFRSIFSFKIHRSATVLLKNKIFSKYFKDENRF